MAENTGEEYEALIVGIVLIITFIVAMWVPVTTLVVVIYRELTKPDERTRTLKQQQLYDELAANEYANATMPMLKAGIANGSYRPYSGMDEVRSDIEMYDHYEIYDPQKVYGNDTFTECYSEIGCERYYYWKIIQYSASSTRADEPDLYLAYVVARRVLTVEQRKRLAPYCACERCAYYWIDVRWCFMCPCCYGCLRNGDYGSCVDALVNTERRIRELGVKVE